MLYFFASSARKQKVGPSGYRFDDDKLEVLKIIAPNISDRENYDEIINALDFISSEEKARSILGIKK